MITRLIEIDRVSKVNGRDRKGSGFMSPTDQQAVNGGWAARTPNVVIIDRVNETDSVSGRTTDRSGLRGALARIEAGEADGIIVAKVDRFARSTVEGLLAILALKESGKVFVSASENIAIGIDEDSPMQNLTLTMLLAIAQWMLESLTANWDNAVQRHIANGVPQKPSYGYRKPKTTRVLVIEHGEARWVRRIFELRAGRMSWTDICRALDAEGAVPQTGKHWTVSAVRRIGHNRVYLGELVTNYGVFSEGNKRLQPIVNLNAHDPIITRELWNKVRQVDAAANEAGGSPLYLLVGLVRCASCGATMGGHRTVTKGKVYRYYECRRKFSWGRCKAPAAIDMDVLDAYVQKRFATLYFRLVARASVDTTALDEALRAEAEATADLDLFTDSPETKQSARLRGQDWYDAQVAKRNAALESAQQQVVAARREISGLGLPVTLAEDWPTMDDETKRPHLKSAFAVVAVGGQTGDPRPTSERVRIFEVGDELPADLPGRRKRNRLVSIPLSDDPASGSAGGEGALPAAHH
jgi:DNA invertase Pin-like site-specific DNA recombinase